MMKHVARRIFLLTALYISIIFGIFFLQFTNGKAFSLSLGSMLVSGSRTMGEDGIESPDLPLHIGVNGLDVFFDQDNSLLAFTGENSSVSLPITDFGERDAGFEVRFTGGVVLFFKAERQGDSEVFSVHASIPQKYRRITVPYKIARSARLEKKDTLTLVSTGKARFSFSQPQTFASGSLQRLAVPRTASTVYYQTWRPAKGLVISELASLAGAGDKALQASTERFAAAALASFREAINSGSYNEALATGYIAEMGRVGMYRAALEAIPESWGGSSGRTWRSSTFLNHLEKTWAPFSDEERNERSRLSRLLADRDPAFFDFPSVLPYLVDRGSSVLLDDIAKLTATLDMDSITPVQAAGILEAVMDAPAAAPALSTVLNPLAESCERRLKASLWRVQDMLYLSGDGTVVDTAATFRVSSVLSRYGASMPGKSDWKAAGNLLSTTLLDFAQDRAEFPARFALSGSEQEKTGVVAKSDRMLMPSEVYPLVMTGNTWLPRAVSFAPLGEKGMWAWTSAKAVSVSRTSEGALRLVARFPVGEVHYMVLRGVKTFYRIQIYGMDFRTDPRFESYNSSGYRYNAETETLYLKMRHKSEAEEVTIWFGEPAVPSLTDISAPAAGDTDAGAIPADGTAPNGASAPAAAGSSAVSTGAGTGINPTVAPPSAATGSLQ